METYIVLIIGYLALINIISGFLFFQDKRHAINNEWRISELKLHILELLGGVFSILILIFAIRHKNKKLSFLFFTFLNYAIWCFILYYLGKLIV